MDIWDVTQHFRCNLNLHRYVLDSTRARPEIAKFLAILFNLAAFPGPYCTMITESHCFGILESIQAYSHNSLEYGIHVFGKTFLHLRLTSNKILFGGLIPLASLRNRNCPSSGNLEVCFPINPSMTLSFNLLTSPPKTAWMLWRETSPFLEIVALIPSHHSNQHSINI